MCGGEGKEREAGLVKTLVVAAGRFITLCESVRLKGFIVGAEGKETEEGLVKTLVVAAGRWRCITLCEALRLKGFIVGAEGKETEAVVKGAEGETVRWLLM